MSWKRLAKTALLKPTKIASLRKALAKANRNRVRILMYHRVIDRLGPNDAPYNAVTVATFKRQMQWLAGNCNVISLDEVAARLRGLRPFPDNAVAITFDDGFRDNYLNAFPILRRFNLPATIYVCGDIIDTNKRLWFDRVSGLLNSSPLNSLRCPALGIEELDLAGSTFAAHNAIHQILKHFSPDKRDAFIDELKESLAVSETANPQIEDRAMLSWSELQEMAENGIAIGAHTMTHPILSQLDDETLEYEVIHCQRLLEGKLGRPIRHFSYPNGALADYDDRTLKLVMATYDSATTTVAGLAGYNSDVYQLPRIHVDDETEYFAGKLEAPYLSRSADSKVEVFARNSA